jgi:hypothetical protein
VSGRIASGWAAFPDALTAGLFLAVWLDPFVFGALSVKTAMLTMLVEFFLIHATGFFTALVNQPDMMPRGQRWAVIGALCGFYVLMIGAFAWSFGEWWPLLAFAWLVVGKFLWIRRDGPPGDDGDRTMLPMAAWAGSVVAYLLSCMATVIPDVPTLGMPLSLQPSFGLGEDSGGLWIDEPHRVVAMGVLYFSLLAAGKLLVATRARRAK